MTFKRPVSYTGTCVIDAERDVIAYTNEEYVAARIADALNHAPSSEKQAQVIDEPTAQLLAAISVASIQNTRTSAKERIGRDSPFWTAAYDDVCKAVDREMAHRENAERLINATPSSERATLPPEVGKAFEIAKRTIKFANDRQGAVPECYSWVSLDLSRALVAVLSTPESAKRRQVGWAGLGTHAGELYVQRIRRVDEGQNDYYHHAVYVIDGSSDRRAE